MVKWSIYGLGQIKIMDFFSTQDIMDKINTLEEYIFTI